MPLVRCRSTIYAGDMRYPDGGGLSPAARERRETVRMQAARLFAEDVAPVQVAARLRVSTKSVYQWGGGGAVRGGRRAVGGGGGGRGGGRAVGTMGGGGGRGSVRPAALPGRLHF